MSVVQACIPKPTHPRVDDLAKGKRGRSPAVPQFKFPAATLPAPASANWAVRATPRWGPVLAMQLNSAKEVLISGPGQITAGPGACPQRHLPGNVSRLAIDRLKQKQKWDSPRLVIGS